MKTEYTEEHNEKNLRVSINLGNAEDISMLDNGEIEKKVDEFLKTKCSEFDKEKDYFKIYCYFYVEDCGYDCEKWDLEWVLSYAKNDRPYKNKLEWGSTSHEDIFRGIYLDKLEKTFKTMRKSVRECVEFYKNALKKEHAKRLKEYQDAQYSLNEICDSMHDAYNLEETWRKSKFSVSGK